MKKIFAFVILAGMISATSFAHSDDLNGIGGYIDQQKGEYHHQKKTTLENGAHIRSSKVLYESPSSPQFEPEAESKTISQEGQSTVTEAKVTSNGFSIMPARIQTVEKYSSVSDLAKEVQANLSFDSAKETVSLNKDNATLAFRVGEKGLTVGRTTYFLNSPSKMENGIVMIPESLVAAVRQSFRSF